MRPTDPPIYAVLRLGDNRRPTLHAGPIEEVRGRSKVRALAGTGQFALVRGEGVPVKVTVLVASGVTVDNLQGDMNFIAEAGDIFNRL